MQKQINLCDILDQYGEDYIRRNHPSGQEKVNKPTAQLVKKDDSALLD